MAASPEEALAHAPKWAGDSLIYRVHAKLDKFEGAMKRLQDPEYKALNMTESYLALELAKKSEIQETCKDLRANLDQSTRLVLFYSSLDSRLTEFFYHEQRLRFLYDQRPIPVQDI